MSWFNRKKETRSSTDTVTNPCYNDSETSFSLSNLLRQQSSADPLDISAFFAGVNMISNSVAMMKWEYKDADDNLLPLSHYLWHLFDNSKLTRFNMVKNIVKDIIYYGNGFAYIERNPDTGKPVTLHYSPASKTNIFYDEYNNDVYFLNPRYSNRWDDGTNYLHFFMNTDTGFDGKSVRNYAYKSLDLINSTEKSALDYYSSGGQLFGIISTNSTTPNVGNKKEQMNTMRQSWDEARSKSKGTGVVFVPIDLKYSPLSSTAKDSALVETRQYNLTEIARWLNISPVLLGDLSHTQYNSVSEAQLSFILNTLAPYTNMIEEECTRKLIMPSRHCREFVDLDESSITAIDNEKQANYLSTLVNNGIMTRNEARHKLGLSQVDGGDDLVIPYTNIQDNTIGDTEGSEDKNTDTVEDEQE